MASDRELNEAERADVVAATSLRAVFVRAPSRQSTRRCGDTTRRSRRQVTAA
jgi:hypothetical protein